MQVEIKPMPVEKRVKWAGKEHKVPLKLSTHFVMVDGVQAGHVPMDPKDPNYRVFHPLSGFPNELVPQVVQDSRGQLVRALRAPVPEPVAVPEADEDDFEDDDA